MTKPADGVVLYTDGSYKPRTQQSGVGVHGYTYTLESVPKKRYSYPPKHITTTNGYWLKSDPVVTPAIPDNKVVYPSEYVDITGGIFGSSSSLDAEIDALYAALQLVAASSIPEAYIYSDNEGMIKTFNEKLSWFAGNKFNKGDHTPMASQKAWMRVHEVYERVKAISVIKLSWVKGHTTDIIASEEDNAVTPSIGIGNTHADILAGIGNNKTGKDQETNFSITHSPSDAYWRKTVDKHPLVFFKKIYFSNFFANKDTPNKLYIAETGGTDDLLWSRGAAGAFGIVELDEVDPVINTVMDAYRNITRGSDIISTLRIDNVYSPEIYRYITEFGENAFSPKGSDMNFVAERIPIVTEIYPPTLTLRSEAIFNKLEQWLTIYKNPLDQSNKILAAMESLSIIDVTESFYGTVTDKKGNELKQLLPTVANGESSFKLKVDFSDRKIPVVLLYGGNIPHRNALKRLEVLNPVIKVMMWVVNEMTIRYAVVVDTDRGKAIYSNYYSDVVYINVLRK